jgi:hypothetical protein
MQNAKIIGILDIALLEVKIQVVFSSAKLQRVEHFCLSFGNGWDRSWAWKLAVSCEEAAEVLNDEFLFLVDVEDWARVVWWIASEADIMRLGSARNISWGNVLITRPNFT